MLFYRITDATIHDLAPEMFATFAQVKQAMHRPYSVAAVPSVTASQKVVAGHVAITDTTATKTWTVVDKSTAEIAAETEAAQQSADYLQAKALYLDLKNGVGTAAERITRIEKVLARMLRDALTARGL